MRLRAKQHGFTTTELLVAVTVTTVVVLVISNFMMRSLQSASLEMAKAQILQEVQLTLDTIALDVRLSANADANNRHADINNPSGVTNLFGWSSDNETLVLATAATDPSDEVIFSDPTTYITTKNNYIYFVEGGILYKRILAAPLSGTREKTTCPADFIVPGCPADKALLRNVTHFQVTYLDGANQVVTPTEARSIEIELTAARTQYKQTQSATYATRMVFRND